MRTLERRSVYERVLGDRFAGLDPALRGYFGPIPAGSVGIGRGVFDIAGSRVRVLRPVFAWLAWRRILFPEFEQEVPFTVVNTPGPDGTLSATRTFAFARRHRVMADTLSVVDGRLVDRLGRRRGLEVELGVLVADGALRLCSRRLALRLGGVRVPLPPFARVTVDEHAAHGAQHVDVRVHVPVVGEVFRYAGTFAYELVSPATATEIEGA